jgi:hypothetical protein
MLSHNRLSLKVAVIAEAPKAHMQQGRPGWPNWFRKPVAYGVSVGNLILCSAMMSRIHYMILFFIILLVTRGGVTLPAGHTHQPDESDCRGLQHCCH